MLPKLLGTSKILSSAAKKGSADNTPNGGEGGGGKKISSNKLLGGRRGGEIVKASAQTITTKSLQMGGSQPEIKKEDDFIVIKNKIIKVDKLIANLTLLKRKELDDERKTSEKKARASQEESLEKIPEKDGKEKTTTPQIPKLGFLERIKKFIFGVILGHIVYKLVPYIPQMIKFVKIFLPAFDFLIDLGGKALNGLVTFIDWGYQAVNKTEKFIKDVGGDGALKMFKNFEAAFTAFINGALIFGMLATGKGKGPKGTKPTRPNGNSGKGSNLDYFDRNKRIKKIEKTYGNDAARMFENDLKNGKSQKGALNRVRSQFKPLAERFGPQRGLLGGTGEGNVMKRGLLKAPKRIALKFLGTGPAKFLTKGLAKIPVIGGLIDFAINLAMGEPIGRAAAKAVGSTAGAALGTLIPIPFAGTILGGYLGDIAGGMLYDSLTGGKKQNAAGGGQITRGGKPTSGPIKRTLKKTKKIKRTLKVQPTKVKPGASVGGEEKIKKIFPEVKTGDNGKKVDTLGYMKSSYDKSSSIPGFGGLFGIALKAQLGQKPSSLDYQNAATGLNAWMQRTYSSEIMRTGGGAFAEGGSVDVGMFSSGGDMTNMIAKSLEDTISIKINDIINDLMKQLGLKLNADEKGEQQDTTTPETSGNGEYSPEGLQGEIYQYLLSKGMDDAHALGIMANISRESGFRPGVLEEGGGGGVGLFQYTNEPRKGNFLKAVPNYKTNWKGQIDYALKEPGEPGQQYLSTKFSSPQEAADWFMRKWERPDNKIQNVSGPKIHAEYLAGLQKYRTKKGGSGSFDFGGMDKGGGSYTFGGGGDAKRGSKLAGELGDFIKQKGLIFGSGPHQHPKHPAWSPESGHSANSLHYASRGARAIDIGGYGRSRGYSDQDQILAAISEFNKMKGVKPVELLKDGYPGHDNHVHVAYSRGGLVRRMTRALIGEQGPEFIIDADSTKALETNFPGFLDAVNKAKYDDAIGVLKNYAYYEFGYQQDVEVETPEPIVMPLPIPMGGSGGIYGGSGGGSDDPYESMAMSQ